MKASIGIDIGGLRLKAAYLRHDVEGVYGPAHEDPQVVGLRVIDVEPADRTPDGMIERLRSIVETFEDLGQADEPIGLGVPGAVRRPDGTILKAANYPGWEGIDLAGALREACGRPVIIENDATLFAFAEARTGAAKGHDDVLGLTLGTGVGGGLVLGGKIHRGAHGLAAEAGHFRLRPDGEPCGCGSRGCVEQYASTRFLQREGLRRLPDVVSGLEPARIGEALAARARDGCAESERLFRELGRDLGVAIAGMNNLLDVSMVVIGGGLVAAWDLFASDLRSVVRERSFGILDQDVRIVAARLGSDAGAIGAAHLALEEA